MNLCIITSTFPTHDSDPIGGFILDFCLKLSENHCVTVITQRRSRYYQIDNKINLQLVDWKGSSLPLSDLKMYNIRHAFFILNLLMNAKKVINNYAVNNKIDYCFALWALPSGIGSYYLLRKFKIPYGVWCLGSDIWKHKKNFITRPFLLKILKNAHQLYADGFNFCKDIEQLSGKTCHFLPSSRSIPKTIIKTQTGVKKTFVFIGRYHFNKGPDVLLDAIELLPKSISENSEFVFYGTGHLKDRLQKRVEKSNLKNIIINNIIETNNIFEVLSLAHFVIIPSRLDSIPVILSDALQCNTPIIGANIGDLGNIIKNYKIGYTFEKENTMDLSKQIIKAFDDKKDMYFSNIQEAMKIFSVENAVDEFINNVNHEK